MAYRLERKNIEVSLFSDDIIVNVQNHKEYKKKISRFNEFNKVGGYKSNTNINHIFIQ